MTIIPNEAEKVCRFVRGLTFYRDAIAPHNGGRGFYSDCTWTRGPIIMIFQGGLSPSALILLLQMLS